MRALEDEYAEYSDKESIDLLGIKLETRPLACFWPTGGRARAILAPKHGKK